MKTQLCEQVEIQLKKTSLFETHCKSGAKMIDFGGWIMPVQYSGIINEHEHVRNAAGLFDVSHMGEILIEGDQAEEFIQKMITNDISAAVPGRAVYSPMCYPNGGVVDDLLIYKLNDKTFLAVVNASNTDKDFQWFAEHVSENVRVFNMSKQYAQLALQGPKAQQILQKLTDAPLDEIKFYRFKNNVAVCGIPAIVSRTGYTGEDGFEIYFQAENACFIWDEILNAGIGEGIVPVGLGARDTLRFEVALPLYGHELSETVSPLEAGLNRFVKLNKEIFIGKNALIKQSSEGTARKLIGFEMTGRGIARNGHEVIYGDKKIGSVTTGNYSPSLKKNLGLALVDSGFTGENLEILIRDKTVEAKVTDLPFYKKKYK